MCLTGKPLSVAWPALLHEAAEFVGLLKAVPLLQRHFSGSSHKVSDFLGGHLQDQPLFLSVNTMSFPSARSQIGQYLIMEIMAVHQLTNTYDDPCGTKEYEGNNR